MQRYITNILLSSIVFLVIAFFYSGFHVSNFGIAIVASVVLSILNSFIRPVLGLFSLPITCLTLGLFSWVLNALMLSLTSWIVGPSFSFSSFWSTLLVSLILALVSSIINRAE